MVLCSYGYILVNAITANRSGKHTEMALADGGNSDNLFCIFKKEIKWHTN